VQGTATTSICKSSKRVTEGGKSSLNGIGKRVARAMLQVFGGGAPAWEGSGKAGRGIARPEVRERPKPNTRPREGLILNAISKDCNSEGLTEGKERHISSPVSGYGSLERLRPLAFRFEEKRK